MVKKKKNTIDVRTNEPTYFILPWVIDIFGRRVISGDVKVSDFITNNTVLDRLFSFKNVTLTK